MNAPLAGLKALTSIRIKKVREKALRRARFLKLQTMAREKKNLELHRQRALKVGLTINPKKKKDYTIIKLSPQLIP